MTVNPLKEIPYLCVVCLECLLEFCTTAAKTSLPGTERKWRRWSRHSFPCSRGQHWPRGWSHVLRLLIVLTGVLPGLSFDCWERPVSTGERTHTHACFTNRFRVSVESEGCLYYRLLHIATNSRHCDTCVLYIGVYTIIL